MLVAQWSQPGMMVPHVWHPPQTTHWGPGIRLHSCGEGKDGVEKGETRLGKGGIPGTCGKKLGDGRMTLAWVLLGVKIIEPPVEASKLEHLPSPSSFSTLYLWMSSSSFSSMLLLLSTGDADSSCTLIISSLEDLASVLLEERSLDTGSPRFSVSFS